MDPFGLGIVTSANVSARTSTVSTLESQTVIDVSASVQTNTVHIPMWWIPQPAFAVVLKTLYVLIDCNLIKRVANVCTSAAS